MLGVALRMGASRSDALDLVQTSLVVFLEAWRQGRYDRARGRISRFLISILRARYLDARRTCNRRGEVPIDEVGELQLPLSDDAMDRSWRMERQRTILELALDRLREEGLDERTLEAFDLYAVRGASVDEVAERLGMTREDVYNAKYRVVRRLQPIVARLDELFEDV